ncbi:conserved hypothetical protein [Gluconacetobacter diazotrophicus PA1 5]|nr:STAS domain-containing protein [Gluconacetobacter diazotrophicus]ACI53190.1 conserved hypothetical protein [Gluconacetobacter diazotrophicus PA1 5]MBB2156059.1 hypothetical protein [Gluconacetobacter diazotrophicus]TWB10436.1 anti-anti-sigma regulatory factor [Gluconacetobacter diazotrophicus]
MAAASLSTSIESGAGPAVCVTLPERLDTAAAFALKGMIEQAKEQGGANGVSLDSSGVAYVGGLCLQILVASGCPLVSPSEQVKEAYSLFGTGEFLSEPLTLPVEQ